MKTSEEFLNDKFNGKGYEFKIHDWINGQVSNYPPCELLEEYASQNTLNRDKVKATLVKDHDTYSWDEWIEKVTDDLCSLSLPTLSEGEIHNAYEILLENGVFDGMKPQHQIDIQEALRMCAKSHTPPQQPSVEPKNTLNRDKVIKLTNQFANDLDTSKFHGKPSASKLISNFIDAICSLSLPTQKRKDPVDPLDSYYLKDGKWHCVECDKPMNLPTLSEEEIEKMAEKNSYFWMSDSKRIVAKQAYKEGFKAALKERTKPKEE
jgi:hypothetical protein